MTTAIKTLTLNENVTAIILHFKDEKKSSLDHSESKMEDEKDLEDSEVSDTPSFDESPLLTHQNNGYAKSNAVKEQIKHHNHGNNCNNHNNHNKKKKKMTKYVFLKNN